MSLMKIANYIGDELLPPSGAEYNETTNPALGKAHALVPESTSEDLALAIDRAQEAQKNWQLLSTTARAEYLRRIANLIQAQSEELALAECNDNGKPLKLARQMDIPRAASNLHFFAEAITQFPSDCHDMGTSALNYTVRDPVGLVGCISPWNLPLYLLTWKIAPALAAGNCVIAKPSEVTPLTAYLFAKICQQAELPAGVLSILHGSGPGIGEAIVTHPKVSAISFTGGSKTGKHLAGLAAPLLKKYSLELGGKNPTLIFADCDWQKMLDSVVRSVFTNQGQVCLCASRLYIERSIFNQFRTAFVDRVKTLRIGDPLESNTDQGAITSQTHFEKILAAIKTAREEGGECVFGGNAVTLSGRCRQGYFIEPTVFTNIAIETKTNQEEIFGPVVTLTPFDNEEEALQLANHSQYGLAAMVWTQNLARAHRVSRQLQAGILWVNCWLVRDLRTPFGGMKQSGVGREGGAEALRFFTEAKNVCIGLE